MFEHVGLQCLDRIIHLDSKLEFQFLICTDFGWKAVVSVLRLVWGRSFGCPNVRMQGPHHGMDCPSPAPGKTKTAVKLTALAN